MQELKDQTSSFEENWMGLRDLAGGSINLVHPHTEQALGQEHGWFCLHKLSPLFNHSAMLY